jgi:hypothetical protein
MALAGSRRIADSILDSVVVSFAAGALAYYSTRLFSTSAVVLVGIWIALVIAIRLLIRKFADDGFYGEPVGGNHVTSDTSVPRVNSLARNASWAGLIAAVLAWLFISKKLPFMSSSEWALIILIFVGIGSVVAIRQASKPVGVAPTYSNFHWIPWVIASGMGLVASATLRPQSDDTNYLNISTWIAERGTLPTKDTIFSDQVFSTKPLGSAWEPLWGALAHATHIAAPTLLYVIAVPILTMLSVFALDRGLRAIHVRHANFALLAASLFLLLDGKNIFSFGVFHGSRIWQGKSFFVSAMIPLLISAGVLWARNGRRNDLIRLILIATAAAGMTTTATMLVPIMLAVFAAVVGYQRGVKSAGSTLTGLAMPLYIGLTFRKPPDDDSAMGAYNSTLAAIHPATLFNSLGTLPDANEFLRWMSKPALHAALFALVMCWGWLGAESRTARRVIAGLSLSWAIVYLPPVLGSIDAFTGVSAISWRFWWLIPIPMLVGSAASAVVTGLVRLTKTNRMRFAVSTLALAMLVSCIVIPGKTVWTSSLGQLNGQSARLAWPPGWKVFGGYYDAKLILDEIALDGDIVAARSNIEKSLAATTVRVHPVLPKISWYTQAGGAEAKASLPDRLQIRQFTSTQPDPQLPELNLIDLPNALDRVGVNVICLDADRKTDIDLAKSWGYVGGAQVVKLGSGRGQWCARKN